MSVLALKALAVGAEKIPDKVFHKVPGGFFTPTEKRDNDKKKKRDVRHRSEDRARRNGDKRRSHRERTPPTDHSEYSGYDDTDYESEFWDKKRNRRAKSLGRSPDQDRSFSRGRYRERSRDLDGEYDMDRAERGPEFPPPPGSEYRPYNPADYAPPTAGHDYYDRRNSPVMPDYGYPPQPPAHHGSVSSSAAKYTPGPGYAPSPGNSAYAQPNVGYSTYNPSEYAAPPAATYAPNPATYTAPGNAYPSPPPFYRQQSRSQPSLAQYPYPTNQLIYAEPPKREDSTSSSRRHRHGDEKRHRARSADHRGRSQSSVADKFRDRLENFDVHDKNLAASVGGALAGGLAGRAVGHGTLSTLAGAAIGAFGGREFEKRNSEKKKHASESSRQRERERSQSRNSSKKHDDYSRSQSRDRSRRGKYDDYDSYSDSDSEDDRKAARRRRRNSRRSKRESDDRF